MRGDSIVRLNLSNYRDMMRKKGVKTLCIKNYKIDLKKKFSKA